MRLNIGPFARPKVAGRTQFSRALTPLLVALGIAAMTARTDATDLQARGSA